MKKKIIDPSTGKEIWVIVDAEGNILESDVAPPDGELTDAQKKENKDNETTKMKEELEALKQLYTMNATENANSVKALMEMVKTLTETAKATDIKKQAEEVLKEEKVVYVENPENAQINKSLLDKVALLQKRDEEATHREFIKAQLESKPYLKELVTKLGVTTREAYIKTIMPLEEREEELYTLKQQLKNNQGRDMYDEYGIGRKENLSSSEDKIAKSIEDEATSLFSRLIN